MTLTVLGGCFSCARPKDRLPSPQPARQGFACKGGLYHAWGPTAVGVNPGCAELRKQSRDVEVYIHTQLSSDPTDRPAALSVGGYGSLIRQVSRAGEYAQYAVSARKVARAT